MIHRVFPCLVLAGALLCAGAASARAHAFLDRASPAVGSTVHTPPSEVRIQYTEELEPAYSTAHVEDAAGATVSTNGAHVDQTEQSVLIVPLGALKPGRYKVIWKVLSVDTHVTNGTFTFTVAP
ncbi:MAG TPA: copper resistance CopC family protein [Stellaceae bacterium]|nr:copper resistance CopC family protein [Stellaceae bacterium]